MSTNSAHLSTGSLSELTHLEPSCNEYHVCFVSVLADCKEVKSRTKGSVIKDQGFEFSCDPLMGVAGIRVQNIAEALLCYKGDMEI